MTEQRKQTVAKRFREDFHGSLGEVRSFFERVERSDFLAGRVRGRDFRASFDWVFKPINCVKILEGNYDNRTAPIEGEESANPQLSMAQRAIEMLRGGADDEQGA